MTTIGLSLESFDVNCTIFSFFISSINHQYYTYVTFPVRKVPFYPDQFILILFLSSRFGIPLGLGLNIRPFLPKQFPSHSCSLSLYRSLS